PLCIATLMSLDIDDILCVADQDSRTVRVWSQLSHQIGGIPSGVLFFEDHRLDVPSWRWAPRRFLSSDARPIVDSNGRILRWGTYPLGQSTSLGLQAQLPGFRILPTPRPPRTPLCPREAINRPKESYLALRVSDGVWCRMIDSYRAMSQNGWNAEELDQYDPQQDRPLRRLIQEGNCAVILTNPPSSVSTIRDEYPILPGILVQVVNQSEQGIEVRFHMHVMLTNLLPIEIKILETTKKLAERLRDEPITQELLSIPDRESEQYQTVLDQVRLRMKGLMIKAYEEHPWLEDAIHESIGAGLKDHIWVNIAAWFAQDNAIDQVEQGKKVWFVD
ncbi:hypothetical protein V8E54_008326, partial [Elaphomyces granulatus]